ncbi:uncharacterized protein RJT21DRAFT_121227 [Scheffersomyces amazonensis]|uniref:uncharacterized protein n=1 Tax=Scheffersomyces amazonensis TaxID=1078765 RepID=UPI00315DB789
MDTLPMKMLMYVLDPTNILKVVPRKKLLKFTAHNSNSQVEEKRTLKRNHSSDSNTSVRRKNTGNNNSRSHGSRNTVLTRSQVTNANVISSSSALAPKYKPRTNSGGNVTMSPMFSPPQSPFFDGISLASSKEEAIEEEDSYSITDDHYYVHPFGQNSNSYTYDIGLNTQSTSRSRTHEDVDNCDDVWSYNPEAGHTVILSDEDIESQKKVRFS